MSQMPEPRIAKIEEIDEVREMTKSLDDLENILQRQSPQNISVPTDSESFAAFMDQKKNPDKIIALNDIEKDARGLTNTQPTKKPTLIDAIRDANNQISKMSSNPSSIEIVEQTKKAIKSIEIAKDQLSTKNLELKPSIKNLLRTKLTVINEGLQVALAKAGVEVKMQDTFVGIEGPLNRFLGMLTGGQEKLHKISAHVQGLAEEGNTLKPEDMLAIQIKVHKVQHEIELFSSILNKSLESVKTIMNVQV